MIAADTSASPKPRQGPRLLRHTAGHEHGNVPGFDLGGYLVRFCLQGVHRFRSRVSVR